MERAAFYHLKELSTNQVTPTSKAVSVLKNKRLQHKKNHSILMMGKMPSRHVSE
jgi:hypothetical protein